MGRSPAAEISGQSTITTDKRTENPLLRAGRSASGTPVIDRLWQSGAVFGKSIDPEFRPQVRRQLDPLRVYGNAGRVRDPVDRIEVGDHRGGIDEGVGSETFG